MRSNWGRWGPDDERGALNLIDAAAVRRGAAAVRAGRSRPLAAALDPTLPAYYPQAMPTAFTHQMVTAWRSNAGGDVQAASDQIAAQCHGLDVTHIDALCHIGHRGTGWNGTPFASMVGEAGATAATTRSLGAISTRAVLADVPRHLGLDHLPPGTAVRRAHLEHLTDVVQPGDALLVRTGRWRAPARRVTDDDRYGRLSGLHPDALAFVSEHDVAVVGTDGGGDTFPNPEPDWALPIHTLALVYLGVPLLHSLDLEALAADLAVSGRVDCQLTVGPLQVPGGTGTPVTPVASY